MYLSITHDITKWDVTSILTLNVGTPTLPTYDGVNPKQLLKLFPDYGDVYNIAWTGHQSNWLLAGTAAGLVGWNVESKKVTEQGTI